MVLGPRLYDPATTPLHNADTFVAGRHEDFPEPRRIAEAGSSGTGSMSSTGPTTGP